jgi:hypothetical protein
MLKVVQITTVGEKSGARDELGVLMRSTTHPPHWRRGQPAVVEVNVIAVIVPRPRPFNHIATSCNSSPMTPIASQPVSATVNHAGDSSLLPGRQRNPFELDTTAHGLYKLSMP